MKSIIVFAALPLFVSAAPLPSHPRLLFNSAGIAQLKQRVQQEPWSAQWKQFQTSFEQTLAQPLELPPRGSNWFHWYVCPKHGQRLTTGKRLAAWQWEHICPVDREVFRGDPAKPQTDFDGCALSGPHTRYAIAIRDAGILYQVTGDARYARRAREILLAYAAKYLDYPLHTTTNEPKIGGGRVGPQTLDEAVWLIPVAQGADLIWDTLSEADRQTIAEKLVLPAARDVILPHRMGIHNIQCWKNSALGLAGFLLGDQALIGSAIDDPDRGHRAQMAKGVQADGAWFEGAWGYHFYTMSALWPLVEAARNNNLDLYGEPFQKMFEAPVQLSMPNLMLPAFNDSAETSVRSGLYELAYARYHDPVYLPALAGSDRRNEFALWFGVDRLPAGAPATLGSRKAEASGYAILQQKDTWLCLKFGPHGGGHGHPDKNNFILYRGGQVLFPDPGTRPYGSPLHAEWDRATLAHNTLVVDEKPQAQATGKLLAFGDNYAMVDAGAIYPGVRFIRTAAMLNENLIVFVDRVTADKPHTFDLANHFTIGQAMTTGEKIALPTKDGYQHLQNASVRRVNTPVVFGPITLIAADEPTDVITATGPGKSTEERIPIMIFRRTGQQTTYVWVVGLDGPPAGMDVKIDPDHVTVKTAPWTLTVNTAAPSVRITR